jgi:hypothetical protein
MKFRVQPTTVLLFILFGAVVFNYELYTRMDQISGDFDYTNWNIQLEQAKSSEIEVNQDKYIKSLEHRKLAFETVDSMYAAYQYLFRVIVIFNVTLITFLCAYASWFIFKLKKLDS